MLRPAEGGPTSGFVHAAGFYGSDDEFGRTFAPFCEAGLAAGEATVVRVEAYRAELLRSILGASDDIVFLPHGDQYPHPPGALASVLDLLDRHTAGGTRPLRLLGELPPLAGLSHDAWLRYEAAVNRLFADLPLSALCACDMRTTSEAVQAEVLRSHHVVVAGDRRGEPNARYEATDTLSPDGREALRDPLEDGPPLLGLVDPTPSAARQAVGDLAHDLQVDPGAADAVRLGVSEVLTNAILHGRPPVLVRGWRQPGRVVVSVQDAGEGPADPLVGLLPGEPGARAGGLGLWITHQLCPETALSSTNAGFTVRLAAGEAADRLPS